MALTHLSTTAPRLRGAVRATTRARRLLSAFEGAAGQGDLSEAVQRLAGQLDKPEQLRAALTTAQALEPSHKALLVNALLSGMGHSARAAAISAPLGSLPAAHLEQAVGGACERLPPAERAALVGAAVGAASDGETRAALIGQQLRLRPPQATKQASSRPPTRVKYGEINTRPQCPEFVRSLRRPKAR